MVVIWDEMFTQPLRAFQIETPRFPPGTILLHDCPPVRSIHTDEGRILVGTGHDDIIQIFSDGSMEVILQVGGTILNACLFQNSGYPVKASHF